MRRHIRLRVGIALAFSLAMVPLTLAMVGYLYWSNAKLIVQSTAEIMHRSTTVISRDVQSLISPVERLLKSTTEIVRNDRGSLQRVQGLSYFYRQIQPLPQVYSIYVGFHNSGDFYQVIRIPRGLKSLGPTTEPLSPDADYALRLLDDSSGSRADSFIIYGDWGDVKQVFRGPPSYDPRLRPWYDNAWSNTDTVISKAYVFASSGLVGLTVSHRVETDSGVAIGTVGADITLDTLSAFLEKARIGKSGMVFIVNEEGQLVAHPNPKMGVKIDGDTVQLLNAADVSDPFVSDAVKAWKASNRNEFEAPLGPEGHVYMASFTPFAEELGPNWTIGVIVQKDELIGPLRETSLRILVAGAIFIAISVAAIFILSRLLTNPLQTIVAETRRIQSFDLTGRLAIKSLIAEVQDLMDAVETMKRSLRSFSVYVPKELVRAIVSDAGEAALGSRRQPLTIMFTDIKGFTNASETMSPEEVVTSLSEYFERMSTAVHKTEGIIDKYIGDAIMAMWNAPLNDFNHVKHGCETVLMCRQIDLELAAEYAAAGREPFFTRFGLHTGEAVVGNVGSSERFQYSAFGNIVNVAARLESLNKVYGTQVLISGDVVERAGGSFVVRYLDRVVPVGTSRPIDIYELAGTNIPDSPLAATPEDLARIDAWHAARDLYDHRQWQAAADAFADFERRYPDDRAADLMIGRCRRYLENPPPEDWDGAEWYDTK